MPYEVRLSKRAKKNLAKLQTDQQYRVIEELSGLAENPRHQDTKKLVNSIYYRSRVGDYRIIYEIQDNVLVVMVLMIEHRRDVYKKIERRTR